MYTPGDSKLNRLLEKMQENTKKIIKSTNTEANKWVSDSRFLLLKYHRITMKLPVSQSSHHSSFHAENRRIYLFMLEMNGCHDKKGNQKRSKITLCVTEAMGFYDRRIEHIMSESSDSKTIFCMFNS